MVDRRINFGDPADLGTRYQIEDDANDAGGGNFVLAKDLDGDTVLLQYNPTSDAFEYVRAVDMGGEDVTGVGGVVGESGAGVYDDSSQTVGDGTTSADHESVNTEEADGKVINGVVQYPDPNGDFSSLQDAVDFAATNGHVRVEVNSDDDSGLTIPNDNSYRGIVIFGSGLQDFAPKIADVEVRSRSIEFRNIQLDAMNNSDALISPTGGNGTILRVINCWAGEDTLRFETGARHGVYQSDRVDVVFEDGVTDSVALGNTDSTFTDNDGSNAIPSGSNT